MICLAQAGFLRFFTAVAGLLSGVVGRTLLVACALVCGLLAFDALLCGLEWVLTRDRRASEDAASQLVRAAVLLALTVEGAQARKRLRQALETRRTRRLAAAGPWATGRARPL